MSYNKDLALNVLQQIETAIMRIEARTSQIHCADDFLLSTDRMEKLDAVCMMFIAIGESLKGLDKITNKELLVNCPDIPWSKIMGLRDIIAHHYFDVDVDEVWWILENELAPLLKAIRFLINIVSEVE